MKKLASLIVLLALSWDGYAQLDCEQTFICRVIAPSGIRMRAEPNLKSKMVGGVPYNETVTACAKLYAPMTYEDMEGHWRKVEFMGKIGYMFDGFLEIKSIKGQEHVKYQKLNEVVQVVPKSSDLPEPPAPEPVDDIIDNGGKPQKVEPANDVQTKSNTAASEFSFLTETYNYCGDVNLLKPDLLWYAVYPADEKSRSKNYRIKKVELDIILSKTKVGKGLEFDITTKSGERSIFLLGLNRTLAVDNIRIEDDSDRLRMMDRKVFPGQQFEVNTQSGKMILEATGSVLKSGPCPQLKDYELSAVTEIDRVARNQNIGKLLTHNPACGMPNIYWYGDLTGDGLPEFIFVTDFEEKNHFTLLVSNSNSNGPLYQKQSDWVIDKCY